MRRLSALSHHLRSAVGPIATRSAAADDDEQTESPPRVALEWEEIMRHNTRESLWVVIDGTVFDMTEFVGSDHPGGEEIPLEYAGKDASEFWSGAWHCHQPRHSIVRHASVSRVKGRALECLQISTAT